MLNFQQIYSFGQNQVSETGGRPFSETSLYEVRSIICLQWSNCNINRRTNFYKFYRVSDECRPCVIWEKMNQPQPSRSPGSPVTWKSNNIFNSRKEGRWVGSEKCDQIKSPNVYKSCPKMISLEKWMILTPLQKLSKNVGDLDKLNVAKGFKNLPKKSNKSPNVVTLVGSVMHNRYWR